MRPPAAPTVPSVLLPCTDARSAVFIDKDGTLVENVAYNVDPRRVRFTAGALTALRLLAKRGFATVVVSNQPGLAEGRFSVAAFARLRIALIARIRDEAGVRLAGFYVCPHAPVVPPACDCRKPQPGMLRRAAAAHGYDLTRSWMVGDILDDVEAGRRAGCRTILLDVGNETLWRFSSWREPHYRCADLLAAARVIAADSAAERAAC